MPIFPKVRKGDLFFHALEPHSGWEASLGLVTTLVLFKGDEPEDYVSKALVAILSGALRTTSIIFVMVSLSALACLHRRLLLALGVRMCVMRLTIICFGNVMRLVIFVLAVARSSLS